MTVTRNCAFVNFTNISNAIKAIDGVKNKPDYANLRIAHGKDRCANPPRSGPQGGGARRSNSGHNGPASAGPVSAIEPPAEGVDTAFLGQDTKEEPVEVAVTPVDAPQSAAASAT